MFNLQQIASLPVTATKLAAATHTDNNLSQVYRHVTRGGPRDVDMSLNPFESKKAELPVEAYCMLWGVCVVVPEKLRERLLTDDHVGIQKMKTLHEAICGGPG